MSTTKQPHAHPDSSVPRAAIAAVEWQTIAVAIACYGIVGSIIVFWDVLPLWVAAPVAAYFIALHGSLTHETIHGHPTSKRWFNELLASIPLVIWIPYRRYRDSHTEHHETGALTCPIDDPESFFVTESRWVAMSHLQRGFYWVNQTVLGRLTIGSVVMVLSFWFSEARLILGDARVRNAWILHVFAMAILIGFITLFGSVSIWEYAAFCAFPAVAATNLRTFLEHRPGNSVDESCAVVEAGWLMSLLFLNNNLHIVHHDRPGVPWYQLPAIYAERRGEYITRNNDFFFGSYLQIIKRFLFRPKSHPVHPVSRI